MFGKRSSSPIFSELLNLPNYQVEQVTFLDGIGVVLHIKSQRDSAVCPRCGKGSRHLHQNHYHQIEDLPWGENTVYLRVNARQFMCHKCGKPFTEDLEFTPPRRNYTKRYALAIAQEVLSSNIKSVSERTGISEYRIEHILEDAGEELKQKKPEGLRQLGIDEISWSKGGKRYCGVLVDLESHTVVGLVKSRQQEAMREALKSWGEEILQGIEWVSIDMWRPYKSLVEELMPNAEVVTDRFHVMQSVIRELDNQRKQEYRVGRKIRNKKEREKVVNGLKGSKYVLGKNEEDLNASELEKLEEVKKVSPVLSEMHRLKEEFRGVFEESNNWSEGTLRLMDWLVAAKDKFHKTCQTIVNWFGEITLYFEDHITNGCVEGINNKLRQIIRAGYGFRNFGNFVTRVLLSFSNCFDLPY